MKAIAEELAELLNIKKYSLTFFYRGEKISFNERFGDRNIGTPSKAQNNSTSNSVSGESSSDNFILCLKGGNEGPKYWKRFMTVDDPCR